MAGMKYLYINEECKVYPIPKPKDKVYRAIPELANENVLLVSFDYETKDRKPWTLTYFGFMRVQLDKNGQYIHSAKDDPALYNFLNYGFSSVEEISKKDIFNIPRAVAIPNSMEKKVLINYIKEKFPDLWRNSPDVLKSIIQSRRTNHNKLVDLVKKASAIKKEK